MISIVHISDTHLKPFPELEKADILIHSGDALNYGNLEELIKFRDQLKAISQNYSHVIFVPGNHDRIFEEDFHLAEGLLKETVSNLTILHNSSVQILGFNFYGTADQPEFCNWAFNKDRHELIQSYSNIPENTNILITHCPAYGMLDIICNAKPPQGIHVGSNELQYKLQELKNLKLHCFGHIHFSSGLSNINDIYYSNGAICDEQYIPTNKGNLIELS